MYSKKFFGFALLAISAIGSLPMLATKAVAANEADESYQTVYSCTQVGATQTCTATTAATVACAPTAGDDCG